MNNKTRKWIRAGAEAFISGFTAGVGAPIGASILDPKDWGASWHSVELAGWSALISGGIRFVHWWNANALPPEDETTPPFPGVPSPVISINPLAQRTAPLVAEPTPPVVPPPTPVATPPPKA